MGFEPTTAALEGRGSSAELLPLADLRSFQYWKGWPVLPENIIAGRRERVDVGSTSLVVLAIAQVVCYFSCAFLLGACAPWSRWKWIRRRLYRCIC